MTTSEPTPNDPGPAAAGETIVAVQHNRNYIDAGPLRVDADPGARRVAGGAYFRMTQAVVAATVKGTGEKRRVTADIPVLVEWELWTGPPRLYWRQKRNLIECADESMAVPPLTHGVIKPSDADVMDIADVPSLANAAASLIIETHLTATAAAEAEGDRAVERLKALQERWRDYAERIARISARAKGNC